MELWCSFSEKQHPDRTPRPTASKYTKLLQQLFSFVSPLSYDLSRLTLLSLAWHLAGSSRVNCTLGQVHSANHNHRHFRGLSRVMQQLLLISATLCVAKTWSGCRMPLNARLKRIAEISPESIHAEPSVFPPVVQRVSSIRRCERDATRLRVHTDF